MPLRKGWRKVEAWFIHLLHLDDSAHAIALGAAIGAFVAMTPTWGIQMLLVVAIAWILRANKVAGLPIVWLTNPATTVPVYSFCYAVGHALVGGPGLEEVKEALAAMTVLGPGWSMMAQDWARLMWHSATPLWVGCSVVGAAAGAIIYAVMYVLITVHRRRRPASAGAAPLTDNAGEDRS